MIEPRRHRRAQRSGSGRAGARQVEARAGRASRARRNSRPTASASASPRAPATTPTAPSRFLTVDGAQFRTQAAAERRRHRSARARLPVRRIRRRRSGSATRTPTRVSSTLRGPRAVDATRLPISPASTASSTARIRAKASCAAAASCIRGSASPSPRPTASPSTTPRRRCSASSDGGGQALRLDVVRVPAEQKLAEYLIPAGSRTSIPALSRRSPSTAFPARTAAAKGDQWYFRLYAVRFGSDVYRFIFAAKHRTPRNRPRLPRIDRHLPPHEPRRDRGRQAAAPPDRDRRAQRHGREAGRPGWRSPTGPWNASACSTGSIRGTG